MKSAKLEGVLLRYMLEEGLIAPSPQMCFESMKRDIGNFALRLLEMFGFEIEWNDLPSDETTRR